MKSAQKRPSLSPLSPGAGQPVHEVGPEATQPKSAISRSTPARTRSRPRSGPAQVRYLPEILKSDMADKIARTLAKISERSRTGHLKPHELKYYINYGPEAEFMPDMPTGGTLVLLSGPNAVVGADMGDGYYWVRIVGPHLTQVGWSKAPSNTTLKCWTRYSGPGVPVRSSMYTLDGSQVNKVLVHFL